MDNALNNDIMIITLSHSLHKDFGLKYDLIHYRIHYQGYVINLVIKSFLFIINKELLKEDTETNVYNIIVKEIEN
jgi:hypothetical protein